MSDGEADPRWYCGESSRDVIERHLAGAQEGTYTVYKPVGEHGKLVLALKAFDAVTYKDILAVDDMYGFTEPLQYDNVEEVLETFNGNSHHRFYQQLKQPLVISQMGEVSVSYERPAITDPVELLKSLRTTAKLRTEKDEEICALQDEITHLNESLQKLSMSSDALGGVLKTLERQIQRHRSLEAGVLDKKTADTDVQALSSNYQKLVASVSRVQQNKDRVDGERKEAENRKNDRLLQNRECRDEVESLQAELEQTRGAILRLYPDQKFKLFIERLLADEHSSDNMHVQSQSNVNKKVAEKRLTNRDEGSFMIWPANRQINPYCISIVFYDGVKHVPILYVDGYYGFDKTTCIFETLDDLVLNYGRIPFGVHGDEFASAGGLVVVQEHPIRQRVREMCSPRDKDVIS